MTTPARASASIRTVASPKPEAPPVTKNTALSNGFNFSSLVDSPPDGIVVVRQLDRLVSSTRGDPRKRARVIRDLEVGELQSIRRRNDDDAIARPDLFPLAKLDEDRERDPRVRAVEHSRPIGTRGRVGQLRLGRLLDDAVVFLQRADGLLHRNGVANLNRRGK